MAILSKSVEISEHSANAPLRRVVVKAEDTARIVVGRH
jgi:hypothetical protein